MSENVELRRALEFHKITVSVRPAAIKRDPPLLIDGFIMGLHRADAEPLDYVRLISINFALHDLFGTTASGRRAIQVADWDQAQAEAGKYDAVALFGEHLFEAWRSSMSLSAYYPKLAPGGPYDSYGAYRHRMEMEEGPYAALQIIGFVGPDAYEAIERAAREDAKERLGDSFGDMVFERRTNDIYAMAIDDPIYVVDDAAFAAQKVVPEQLARHHSDGDRLACPYCSRLFERHQLAIVPHRAERGRRWEVAWGCRDCTGDWSDAITLERMPDVESAMRWTIHMMRKSWMLHPIAVAGWIASLEGIFGENLSLWREATL